MPRKGEFRLADALPAVVSVLVDKLASVALVPLIATFLYFVYALFSGYVRAYPQLAYAHRVKVLHNLEIAATIFVAAAIFWVVYALLHLWENNSLAAGLVGIGAALYFGTPFAITQILGRSMANNTAAATIQEALTNVGIVTLIAGVIRAVPELFGQLQSGLKGVGEESAMRRASRQRTKRTVHPLSPCWRLPYCQPYIRDYCPRYSEKRTCWRKKAGCMCDDNITTAALLGGGGTSSAAKERLLLEFLPGAGGDKRTVTRRLKCQNCFIFLEHQRIKHKYVAPLAVPSVVAAFYFTMPSIEVYYLQFGKWATQAVQSIALGTVNTRLMMDTFTNPLVKWLVVFCVGIYALTYLLRFLELMFFKWKI